MNAFSFGPFRLLPEKRTLWKSDEVVPLGSRAFDILVAMVEHDRKVLAPGELMAMAWPGLVVEDSNVRVQVAKLRRALGCGHGGARYIANVAGRGYSFVAPVRRIDATECVPSAILEADALAEEAPATRVAKPPRLRSAFPRPLDRAIGREQCAAELGRIVTEGRLTTVVGAAGSGKTTLAILVADGIETFEGSKFFVDLSVVDREDRVAEAMASAVGYMPSEADVLQGLIEVLAEGRSLIVLDNCEHVIAEVAALCLKIVQETRNVFFLNTSREALRVRDEFVYLLRPLAFPAHIEGLTLQEAMTWPAIQLFMERAKEGGVIGALSDEEVRTVAALCRRLDGNPHAIGLVASRVGTYGIQGVADLFASQFALQWQGRRDDNPRHQTVEALIDWSHNLLPERGRQVLQRLSVFSGSFPVEAAVAVTSDDMVDVFQVREAIGDLVDKSLVTVSIENGATYLRLLETTRAYATARLARVPGGERFMRRHALYYAEQLRKLADVHVMSQSLDVENVRTAIEWGFSAAGDPTLAATMWSMAAPRFLQLGLVRECKRTCERCLYELPARLRSTRTELDLLESTATTYFAGADYDGAMKPLLERGLELCRQLGDSRSMFHFLTGLHLQMITTDEFESAPSVCEQYSSLALASGGPTEAAIATWMSGSSKHYVGDLVGADADFAAGRELVDKEGTHPLHYFEIMEEIIAGINTARVRWALGLPTQALKVALSVIEGGRKLPGSLAMRVTLCFPILLSHDLTDEARGLIQELENLSIDYNSSVRRQVLNLVKGYLLVHLGKGEAAADHLQQCLAMLPPPKMSVVRIDALQALAEAHRLCGNPGDALKSIDEALDLSRGTGAGFNFPDLLRTKAAVLMCLPDADEAEIDELLSEAMDRASRQGALLWELRAALAMATMRARKGDQSGRQELERVYSRFSEGFGTRELRAAAHLLRSM
jgi:predicted ATPase/DNA-binding winged helix-turn-helix (wHTH) protein